MNPPRVLATVAVGAGLDRNGQVRGSVLPYPFEAEGQCWEGVPMAIALVRTKMAFPRSRTELVSRPRLTES